MDFHLGGGLCTVGSGHGGYRCDGKPDLAAASGQSAAGGNLFGIVLHFSFHRYVGRYHCRTGSCSCRYRGQDGCQRGFHDGGSSGWCLFRRQPVLHFRYDHRGYPYARVRDARQVPGEFIDCPSGCLAGICVLCYIWKPY